MLRPIRSPWIMAVASNGYWKVMGEAYLERERKFDVPADFDLPDLAESGTERHELRAIYFDTDDALLQARGVTLRHRTGGSDDGWHLKVPHPEGRLELHAKGEPQEPPEELVSLVRGLRLGQPLAPQAVLRTTREAHQVRTDSGDLVAEVADDRVLAEIEAAGSNTQWREVEIELASAADRGTMDRLADLVMAAGGTPSEARSKYVHAMGEPTRRRPTGLRGPVDDYLQTQYERLGWGDLRMRRGENAVHKTRVAVRRIRSTVRVFAPLFDPDRAAWLDKELKWYAGVLGAVRDLDVFRSHLEQDLLFDSGSALAPVAGRELLERWETTRERRWRQVLRSLDGRRYQALLDELDRWQRESPWTPAADVDLDAAEGFLEQARRKSDKRLRQARSAAPDVRGPALHRARKAAKRTRYAAELARPILGKPAQKIAKKQERRQEELGEIQDHRMMIDALSDLARGAPDDVAFTCGVLAQRHAVALDLAYQG